MTSAEGYYKTGDLGSTGADTLVALEQSVGAIILVRVMEVSEHLFEFAEEQRLRIGWHSAKVGKGRDELLRKLLAGQCDVVLVDRDGLPHQLVQVVPLIVCAYEVVKCRKRIALQPIFQSETGTCSMTFEVMKHRPIANNVHAGTNEELDVITESTDLHWCQTSALETPGRRQCARRRRD
jgi:hypothetical protein